MTRIWRHQQNGMLPGYRKLKLREALRITLASSLLGLLYSVLTDTYDSFIPFINGSFIGFVCGIGIAWNELVIFDGATRRMNFLTVVSLKVLTTVLMVTITIFTVILVSRSIIWQKPPLETLSSEAFNHFLWKEDFHYMILYAFGMACLIIFTRQMSRKMGPGVLLNFISGKYAKPFHESRIFLFIDLDASTALAENLGDLPYHRLLNEFFCDIAEPAAALKGSVYHYVGDEAVITGFASKFLKSTTPSELATTSDSFASSNYPGAIFQFVYSMAHALANKTTFRTPPHLA